jgi:demethylmenaquinone methyltransferase/2-methoxy-6-polyprenyl-1,4-benzoquinol methylase
MSRKRYFNKRANTWDERFNTPNLSSLLEKLVPQFGLEPGQNILDVGTGTGVLITYLIREVGPSGSVTAIDYSENMIRICKTKHSHLKNVSVELKSIEEDLFPAESFDAVTCFGVFPHLENKEKALRNINHTLKSDGMLIVAHALSSEELKAHHNSISSSVVHDVLPKEAEMKQLLEQTGFTKITVNDEPRCYLCIAHKF